MICPVEEPSASLALFAKGRIPRPQRTSIFDPPARISHRFPQPHCDIQPCPQPKTHPSLPWQRQYSRPQGDGRKAPRNPLVWKILVSKFFDKRILRRKTWLTP